MKEKRFELSVLLSENRYTEKPKNVGGVRAEITQEIRTTTRKLADYLTSGYAIIPAICKITFAKDSTGHKRYHYDFVRQQVFLLDIDNSSRGKPLPKAEQILPETAIRHLKEKGIFPCFVYRTYSDTPETPKFRIVIAFSEPVLDKGKRDSIQKNLGSALGTAKNGVPYADTKCFDASRLFFGTDKQELLFADFDALNDAESVISVNLAGLCTGQDSRHTQGKTPKIKPVSRSLCVDCGIIEAIRQHDSNYIRQKMDYPHKVFDTAGEMWDFLYKDVDFADFLGVPQNTLFSCCLDGHTDVKPSANVFQTEAGTWVYKCFSHAGNGIFNIRQFVEKVGNFKTVYSSMDFLKKSLNFELEISSWQQKQIFDLDYIGCCLDLGQFAEMCPSADRVTRFCKDIFRTLVTLAKTYCLSEEYQTKNGESIFFATNNAILRKSGRTLNRKQQGKVSNYLAVLAYLGMIRKIPDSEVPKKLLRKAQQIVGGAGKRHIQFYAIPAWVVQHTEQIESYGRKYIENGYRAAGISFELFCRTEGIETAMRAYPQIAQTKSGKARTTYQQDIRHECILDMIANAILEDGYAREQNIIEQAKSVLGTYYGVAQVKRSLPEILIANGWKRVKTSKELKERFGIDSAGYPYIIVPETD